MRLGKVGGNYDKQVTSYIAPDFGLQDYGYGYALAKTILEAKDPATAWIAMNDRLVIGALSYLREQKIRVPDDLSLVGFDNLDIAAWYDPPITSVDQVIPKVFRESVARLVASIQVPQNNTSIEDWILPKLIIRKTT